jgi:hypothetical protein
MQRSAPVGTSTIAAQMAAWCLANGPRAIPRRCERPDRATRGDVGAGKTTGDADELQRTAMQVFKGYNLRWLPTSRRTESCADGIGLRGARTPSGYPRAVAQRRGGPVLGGYEAVATRKTAV